MPERSEREKMLAGEIYDIFDPELVARRQRVKELLRAFHRADSEPERLDILRHLLGRVGEGSLIEPPFHCSYGENTYLGDHVFLNATCTILDNNEVRIGDHVMFGPWSRSTPPSIPCRRKLGARGGKPPGRSRSRRACGWRAAPSSCPG